MKRPWVLVAIVCSFGNVPVAFGNADNDVAKAVSAVIDAGKALDGQCSSNQPWVRSGCLEMAEAFCDELYKPGNEGNLQLAGGTEKYLVRLGKNDKDFDHAFVQFANAKVAAKDRLPKDFLKALDDRRYFDKLLRLLSTKPYSEASVSDVVEVQNLADETALAWSTAYKETTVRRLEVKYPRYYAKKNEPDEVSVSNKEIHAKLDEEISTAIWAEHPGWKTVERDLEVAKAALIKVVKERLGVSDAVKAQWSEKIANIKLVIPGTRKLDMNIWAGCESTEVNAAYFPTKNVVTVCGGNLTSGDVLLALTHELAHSIGPGVQSETVLLETTDLAKLLSRVHDSACGKQEISCEEWPNFKRSLQKAAKDLKPYSGVVPYDFAKCLQGKVALSKLMPEAINRAAKEWAAADIDELGQNNVFLDYTKKELPNADGSTSKNNSYMNPCVRYAPYEQGTVFSREPEVLFVNEYRCSGIKDAADRLDKSISAAQEMASWLYAPQVAFGGRFSKNTWMQNQGFSKPVDEQFADIVGTYAYADIMEQRSLDERRARFFAGAAVYCPQPSSAKAFPREYEAQKKHTSLVHSEGMKRFKEVLTKPIRDLLSCSMPEDHGACSP